VFELYHLSGCSLLPQHIARQDNEREQYYVHGIAFPPQPMLLLRQLLSPLLAQMDDSDKQQLYGEHEALLSLVFGGTNSTEANRPYEQKRYRPLIARLESNLTHNLALSHHLIQESARLLVRLFGQRKIRVAISDYSRLDDMSTRLMFHLIQHSELDIHWCVGLPERYHTLPRIEVLGHGIQWLPPMQNHRNSLFGLRKAIAFKEIHVAESTQEEQESDEAFWLGVKLADEDLAWDARAIHIIYPQAMSSGEDEWFVLFSAACHSFQLFAFASALFFAQHAIAMGRGYLSAQRRAILHGICAVAAHNRQFFAESDDAIARYILNQLRQAIALEENAPVRCAHWYRLAVTEGRRLGQIGRALAHVSDGFGEIGRGLMSRPEALLAEAWLYNIKGYCLARDHQPEAAEASMTQSYQILEGRDFSNSGLEDEARLTLAVTVENTMKLMRMMGQSEKWRELQQTAEQLSSPWPVFAPAHLAEKADLAIYWLDLRMAVQHAEQGIRACDEQMNAPQGQYFATMLAELYLRAQLWEPAVKHFLTALQLPYSLDQENRPSDFPIRIACVRAMLGAGRVQEAWDMLQQCCRGPAASDSSNEHPQLSRNDRLLLGCLKMEACHRLDNEEELQRICDEQIANVKEVPELASLALLNSYIASIACRRQDKDTAQATAQNSWQQSQILLTALLEKRLRPSSFLLDAVFKSFLHPLLLPEHDDKTWQDLFTLEAKTLRSHTTSWLYLDPIIKAMEQFGKHALLNQAGHAGCFNQAVRTRQECQAASAHLSDSSADQAASNQRAQETTATSLAG
jgi:hypothetical protein